MEQETLRNRLNKIYSDQEKLLNAVDRLIADIVNEDAPKKKKKTRKKVSEEISKPLADMGELNRELTVTQILERHPEQPKDDDHIQSVVKCVNMHNITAEQLEDALDRVKRYQETKGIDDIRRFTYRCLHNMNKGAD